MTVADFSVLGSVEYDCVGFPCNLFIAFSFSDDTMETGEIRSIRSTSLIVDAVLGLDGKAFLIGDISCLECLRLRNQNSKSIFIVKSEYIPYMGLIFTHFTSHGFCTWHIGHLNFIQQKGKGLDKISFVFQNI